MNDIHSEVVSAFLDGEPVDPDALAAALDDGATRRMLVDFVRIREASRQGDALLPASLATLRRAPLWYRAVPLPAVAALVLFVLLASWFVPRQPQRDTSPAPPTPARILSFEPGVDWQPMP
jgi:negative regulator of sigma E activity